MMLFFQAEDGMRDIGVTGVQTCALPILFALLSMAQVAVAQNTLRARVKDRETKEAVAGATVSVKGTEISAVTDAEGSAQLAGDRKSVVEGESVGLGGSRIIKKKISHSTW